jgi:carboxypeptidase D
VRARHTAIGSYLLAYSVDGKQMCINIYDVRYDDTSPACGMNWPPDIKPVTTYLDVRRPLSALATI